MTEQINTTSPADEFKLVYLTRDDIVGHAQAAVDNQTHLARQTLDKFDASLLTPLNPEIISRQATINIGTIGHVAHGKSTLVKAVSGTNVSAPLQIKLLSDGSPLSREIQKHHYQAWLCERQAVQVPHVSPSPVLPIERL